MIDTKHHPDKDEITSVAKTLAEDFGWHWDILIPQEVEFCLSMAVVKLAANGAEGSLLENIDWIFSHFYSNLSLDGHKTPHD